MSIFPLEKVFLIWDNFNGLSKALNGFDDSDSKMQMFALYDLARR